MTSAIRQAEIADDEAGFALATAMFALAVVGALVAGSFFAGYLEQQSGRNVTYAGQAREAAEAGLAEAISALEAPVLAKLTAGGVAVDVGTTQLAEGVTVHITVARLTSRLYLFRAQGTRHDALGGALATRTLGLLAQLGRDESPAAENGEGETLIPLTERSLVRLY